jgi:hypothetical protein
MINQEDYEQIEVEFAHAEAARQDGFEGRARVCARRAAGIAIRAYARQHGLNLPFASGYGLLTSLDDISGIPDEARQSARYLTERVDTDFNLPAEIDLIAEARRLVNALASEILPGDQQR